MMPSSKCYSNTLDTRNNPIRSTHFGGAEAATPLSSFRPKNLHMRPLCAFMHAASLRLPAPKRAARMRSWQPQGESRGSVLVEAY